MLVVLKIEFKNLSEHTVYPKCLVSVSFWLSARYKKALKEPLNGKNILIL